MNNCIELNFLFRGVAKTEVPSRTKLVSTNGCLFNTVGGGTFAS